MPLSAVANKCVILYLSSGHFPRVGCTQAALNLECPTVMGQHLGPYPNTILISITYETGDRCTPEPSPAAAALSDDDDELKDS